MLRALNEIRGMRSVAILAAIGMSVMVPCANSRGQSSSNEPATPKSTQSATTPSKTGSAREKTTGTARHHISSTPPHNRATASSSAKTPRAFSVHHSTRRSSRSSRTKRVRGQQKIDSERATSIQEALIREHYLTGEPTGVWDQSSEDAMRRYQSDHGWQTKEVPDSRALIKLGLGPNNDHLLNPESAMTSAPIAGRTEAPAASTHSLPGPTPAAAPTVPSHAAEPGPAAPAGDAQPSPKPAGVPPSTPVAQPAPTTPAQDSASPQ
jgi:hypothetical protein